MKKIIAILNKQLQKLSDIPLILIRLTLAYGFYTPAIAKWQNISATAKWFETLYYPFPLFNAYLAATTELVGALLLFLGLGTRIISMPLIFIMLVAIFTVHISHGFQSSNNGFEIPFYYLIMLLTLLVYGSGRLSVDFFLSKKE